jgi:hypothetical protein
MSAAPFYYNFKNKQGLYDLLKSLDPKYLWRIRIDIFDEKTRIQEEKYHAMLNDIATQTTHLNETLSPSDWKRLCVSQFAADCIENDLPRLCEYWEKANFRMMPGLDGRSVVALGQSTREFPKYVAAGFIEWLYAYGADNNINWTEPAKQFDERYAA